MNDMATIESLKTGNPNSPHRAIINVHVDVHELLGSGECRGMSVHKEHKMMVLDASNRELAIKQLNSLLDELRKKCSQ